MIIKLFLNKFNEIVNTFKANKFILSFVLSKKHGIKFCFLKGIMALINNVLPLISTVIPGLIINEIVYDRNVYKIVVLVGILIVVPFISRMIEVVVGTITSVLEKKIHIQICKEFFVHLSLLDIEFREDPNIKTKEDIARETLENSLESVNLFFEAITSVFGFFALMTIVSSLHPLILLVIIINVFISASITKRANDKQNLLNHSFYKLSRYINMFEVPLTQTYFSKEVCLFDLSKYLLDKYEIAHKDYDLVRLKREKIGKVASLGISGLSAIQECILYLYMICNVVFFDMLVGHISIYTSAVHQVSNVLHGVFGKYLEMSKRRVNIEETIEYMNLPLIKFRSGTKTPVFDKESTIEFKNVFFRYPGNDNYVLSNINLTIKADEHLCIVGANGAGKSTFIKLLLRMYRPTSGEILLNGINIYEYDYKAYWSLFAPVFQECTLFGGFSFRENIVLNSEWNEGKFENICNNHGLKTMIDKLPKGIETSIDRWVDEEGVTPSGGETQRMTIARAIYQGGAIFLLDEPTASLDPIAEYEIYTQFNNMITDKCAILITHRLSAVQLADKVAVFNDGEIVEYGTHKELCDKGGVYLDMFKKQSEFYQKNE